jgi:hypothetical protein
MVRNPAEHCSGQVANQNRGACEFVLFRSSANVRKTQDLFFTTKITVKTRFPPRDARQTSEEILPGCGKIFIIAARSSDTRTPA